MLGIPYRTHISNLNKVLNIIDIERLYYCQICIFIKLLHRHQHTKEILLKIENNNNLNFDLNDDIQTISGLLDIEKICLI